jgi:hyperosmotically inducible protein
VLGALVVGALALPCGVAHADQPGDAWITTKVKMAMLGESAGNAFNVNVDTFDGKVTLHGQVASEAEKAQLEKKAREVKGVTDVRNLIAVVPDAAKERVEIEDEKLQANVKTVLERDKALADSDIEVKSVNDGVVVLAGEATTLSDHRRALEDARAVDGVRRVASEIRSPDELSDKEIWSDTDAAAATDATSSSAYDAWLTAKAKMALMAEPGLSPLTINVDTDHGVVTLFGIVGEQATKDKAALSVKQLKGVKGVENELQVVPNVAASRVDVKDDGLHDAIESRLESRDELNDADINVEVKNGVVRLTGMVKSQRDRLTALTVTSATPGVKSVLDGLKIEPPKS